MINTTLIYVDDGSDLDNLVYIFYDTYYDLKDGSLFFISLFVPHLFFL